MRLGYARIFFVGAIAYLTEPRVGFQNEISGEFSSVSQRSSLIH